MASKMFEADVVTAKGKVVKKRVVVAGIAEGDTEDDDREVYDEAWVKDHILTHLHKGAQSVEVRAVKDQAPSSLAATLQQAATETGDPELKRKIEELKKNSDEPKPGELQPRDTKPVLGETTSK